MGTRGGWPRRRIELPWKRLDAGGSNRINIQTGAMERQGRHGIEITFAAATNYFMREERFAFTSSLGLEVEQGGSLVINQTINASGAGGERHGLRADPSGDDRRPAAQGRGDGRQGCRVGVAACGQFRGIKRGARLHGRPAEGRRRGTWRAPGVEGFWVGRADGGADHDEGQRDRDGPGKTIASGGENQVQLLVHGCAWRA